MDSSARLDSRQFLWLLEVIDCSGYQLYPCRYHWIFFSDEDDGPGRLWCGRPAGAGRPTRSWQLTEKKAEDWRRMGTGWTRLGRVRWWGPTRVGWGSCSKSSFEFRVCLYIKYIYLFISDLVPNTQFNFLLIHSTAQVEKKKPCGRSWAGLRNQMVIERGDRNTGERASPVDTRYPPYNHRVTLHTGSSSCRRKPTPGPSGQLTILGHDTLWKIIFQGF
jgi:hypothetical protein